MNLLRATRLQGTLVKVIWAVLGHTDLPASGTGGRSLEHGVSQATLLQALGLGLCSLQGLLEVCRAHLWSHSPWAVCCGFGVLTLLPWE